MAQKFEFPDTGEGVTEGTFVDWKVEEGDEVEEDQTVAEVETDKAVVEVPAPSQGTIKKLLAEEGDTVEVGDVILEIDTGEDGEEQEEQEEESSGEPEEPEDGSSEETETVEVKNSGEGVLALPKVRKLAREKGVELSSIKTGERITEQEVIEAAGGNEEDSKTREEEEVKARPSVRRLAREKGVDLEKVEGSGRGGEITRQDILGSPEKKEGNEEGGEERIEMSSTRKTIAENVSESRFTAPHVTQMDRADITDLSEMRENINENSEQHLTLLPFIMKALRLSMEQHPKFNAELDEEDDEIVLKKFYNFNIAVDTDRGLLSPVIENVDGKNLKQIARDIEETADSARESDLSPEKLRNGTFTVTNVGAIGGEGFTPIINYPQTAILGIGRAKETAEVVEGEVVPRKTVKLSLSYDHRVIDGAEAARFLNAVREKLENPGKLMVEL